MSLFNHVKTTVLAGLLLFSVEGYAETKPSIAIQPLPSLAPMLEKAMPAVVNIIVEGSVTAIVAPQGESKPNGRGQGDNQPQKRKFASYGSGVIVEPKQGYILTNAHVIKNASKTTVTTEDGRRFSAKLVGVDYVSDIAVLQIKADRLPSIELGDSDKLRVGDFVVAIGNPFNLSRYGSSNETATFGIISALERSDLNIEGVENFIQIDAAINVGNSGGALVDTNGQLIGINTAILSPFGGGNVGIGFAIPINMARSIMDQIIQFGSVNRGLMGVFVQRLTPELAQAFNMPEQKGAIVTQVNVGSPAEKAGLRAGDLIQSINKKSVNNASQVKNIVKLLRVGDKVTVAILREGKPKTLHATIADVHKQSVSQKEQNPYLFGLSLKNFNEEVPNQGLITGVQVVGLVEDSPSWQAGLRLGDVITSANGQAVSTIDGLKTVAKAANSNLLLHISRRGGALFLVVR